MRSRSKNIVPSAKLVDLVLKLVGLLVEPTLLLFRVTEFTSDFLYVLLDVDELKCLLRSRLAFPFSFVLKTTLFLLVVPSVILEFTLLPFNRLFHAEQIILEARERGKLTTYARGDRVCFTDLDILVTQLLQRLTELLLQPSYLPLEVL